MRTAVSWFRKAADQGDAGAQHSLGLSYYNGRGVARDYAVAAAWFRKAAEKGNANAQRALGSMYFLGLAARTAETATPALLETAGVLIHPAAPR